MYRSFRQALQQYDEKLENLLKELERNADTKLASFKDLVDLLAGANEVGEEIGSRRLRELKMKRDRIRRTVKEISKN